MVNQLMPVDPEHFIQMVEDAAFRKPPANRRGYDEYEVDRFLDWIVDVTRRKPPVSVKALRKATFARPRRGDRGYDEEDVDTFLDWAEKAVNTLWPS